MPIINVDLPSDDTTADVADYNTPITTILGVLNGQLDDDNIASLSGTKITAGTLPETALNSAAKQGWISGLPAPNTVTYNGNRSYDLVFNSTDLTDEVSNGMRVKLARTATPPTQCTDLESGSSQYWSKSSPSGLSITTAITAMGWVKLESYGTCAIVSQYSSYGWILYVQSDGTVRLLGDDNAGTSDSATSYQSIPLNKWVHIAGSMTINSSAQIYIDGVAVPTSYSNGTCTSMAGNGNLEVGAYGGSNFFDGKICQVGVFNAVLSAATIKSYASQTLAGNETNCVGFWDFDGDGNDSNANANNLTAQASATATTTDSPFNATEYGIVTANSFSTNTTLTVQVPEGCAIPTSGGVSSIYYSTQDVPYGFPRDKGKWDVETLELGGSFSQSSPASGTWYNILTLTVPVGAWNISYRVAPNANANASHQWRLRTTLSTANNSESDSATTVYQTFNMTTGGASNSSTPEFAAQTSKSLSSQTVYYLNISPTVSSMGTIVTSSSGSNKVVASCAYV